MSQLFIYIFFSFDFLDTNPEDDEFFQVSDVELETIHSSLELLPTRANLDLSFN